MRFNWYHHSSLNEQLNTSSTMFPRRIRRRAVYQEVRRFRSTRDFQTWWDDGESNNWKVNSRHPHMRGTVEYWRCAFMEVCACFYSDTLTLMTVFCRVVVTRVWPVFVSPWLMMAATWLLPTQGIINTTISSWLRLHTPKLDFLYDNDFQQDDQNTVHHADVMHAFTPKKAVLVNFQEPGTNMPTTSNASGANTPKKSSAELKLNAPSFAATAARNVRF